MLNYSRGLGTKINFIYLIFSVGGGIFCLVVVFFFFSFLNNLVNKTEKGRDPGI